MKDTLRRIRLFSELDDARLERVAAIARIDHAAAGSVIVEEKEPADDLRGIVEGRVSIAVAVPGQDELPVCTVAAGGILGWSALLPQTRWLATARALKNTTLIVVPGTALLALCEQDHELGYHVMHRTFEAVAQRLHDTWLQLVDSYGQ